MVLSLPARRSQLLSQWAGVALYLDLCTELALSFSASTFLALSCVYELQNLRRNKVFYGVRCGTEKIV